MDAPSAFMPPRDGARVRRVLRAGVFVTTAEPEAGPVAPAWSPVEPLVHAPEAVQPARVGRVGVIDDAVLAHERAHAGSLPGVRCPIRARLRREVGERTLLADRERRPF